MNINLRQTLLLIALIFMVIIHTSAQEVRVIKADQLYDMLDKCDSDLCIYNFWATWCAPCIRELPQFESLSDQNKNLSIKLISLDDVDELNGSVKIFIEKRNIISEVFLLDETDYNEIIPNVNDKWSGAIPATLIIDKNGQKYFYEKEFKEGELLKTINSISIIQN